MNGWGSTTGSVLLFDFVATKQKPPFVVAVVVFGVVDVVVGVVVVVSKPQPTSEAFRGCQRYYFCATSYTHHTLRPIDTV